MRDAFADLVLAGCCAGCGRPGRVLCGCCARALPEGAGPARPNPAPAGLPAVHAAGEYADPLRRLVIAHKEHAAYGLTRPLGGVLATALAAAAQGAGVGRGTLLVVVPVPSSPAATRGRGHDPVLRMARVAVRELGASGQRAAVARMLRVAQPVADQAGLDAVARAANLAGRFAVRSRVHRRLARVPDRVAVLLCDDVLTTGATLAESQRALVAVGVPALAAGTLAATRLRLPPKVL